jgi:hypothetical protein
MATKRKVAVPQKPSPAQAPVAASAVLANLPPGLRADLIAELNGVERNYREHRWKPAELDGGRLCEVVYSILKGHVDSNMPVAASKPNNFVDSCAALAKATGFPHSVRITVPRVLVALYDLRNNRNVGHVGGEVDPNQMDATVVLAMAKWLVAEIVRLFHSVDTATATAFVEALIERETPLVWEVDGARRVLNPALTMKDRSLLLLHGVPGAVPEATLRAWTEAKNSTDFRRNVLKTSHAAKLIEYNQGNGMVTLSPAGRDYVEQRLGKWVDG